MMDHDTGKRVQSGMSTHLNGHRRFPRLQRKGSFIGIIVSLVLLLGVLASLPITHAHASNGSWTLTGSMSAARYNFTATLLYNGKVLVAGGTNFTTSLASAELYDPNTGTWTPTGSMNVPRNGHTATLLSNGDVLVVGGGNDDSSLLASAELYDPNTGTWTLTGSMNVARSGHTATLLSNGEVLAAGGFDTSAELYDPSSGTWTLTGSMSVARYAATATLLSNGQVLVAGGTGNNIALTSAELYDPSSGTWTLTGSMNVPRYFHTATLMPTGQVLVVGGLSDTSGDASAATELYDPNSGTWTLTGSMNVPRYRHTTTLLSNGEVLVAGGTGGGPPQVLAELYDPSSGTWTSTSNMNVARIEAIAVLLPTGQVLVAGGLIDEEGHASASAELFSLSSSSAPTITSANSYSTGMRTPFVFHVTTTGSPKPTITETGTLPSGVTFTDNGDGTAQLAGTAPTGSAGTYPITFTANNGIGTPATQNFVLTVTTATSAPTITSSASDTATFGVAFSFTVTTTGYPAPTLTKTGSLPSGVTFTNNGDGTATIAGTPTGSAMGNYALTIKAKNSISTATQNFTLTITKAPMIASISTKTANVGTAFSLSIHASGYPTPAFTESGALPSGLTFTDNGNGTAALAGTPSVGSGGSYSITVTATNQLGTSSQTFALKVNEAPTITSAASANATQGSPFSFQVTTMGFPIPTLSISGTLPKGVTFQASTGKFSGTPKSGTAGSYPITITAKNSSGTVTQNFVLTVH